MIGRLVVAAALIVDGYFGGAPSAPSASTGRSDADVSGQAAEAKLTWPVVLTTLGW